MDNPPDFNAPQSSRLWRQALAQGLGAVTRNGTGCLSPVGYTAGSKPSGETGASGARLDEPEGFTANSRAVACCASPSPFAYAFRHRCGGQTTGMPLS
jgi:hypothetical protein